MPAGARATSNLKRAKSAIPVLRSPAKPRQPNREAHHAFITLHTACGCLVVAAHQLRLASVVIFVDDLARSVDFYSKLFLLAPSVRNNTSALLVGPAGNQLYLTAVGDKATHAIDGIGYQYVIWTADDDELKRCEGVRREQSDQVTLTDEEGFRILEGRDPDGLPVLISYSGPDRVPRREIIDRIYN